ncbi:MAG: alpha-L-rhamnosidase C-terminal domain-containing protein [Eubacteriales bacterium]
MNNPAKKTKIISIGVIAVMLAELVSPLTGLAANADEGRLGEKSPIAQPYEYVSGGLFSGEEQPYSPDPLVSYRWDNPTADDELQIFLTQPVSASSDTPDSFSGLESVALGSVDIEVKGEGTILIDFGCEYAGWLEIDSPDLCGKVTMGISEFNRPTFANPPAQSISKTKTPVRYGDSYRLELNDELYEGVRFGFINIEKFDKPFHITGIRLVCQTKPVNYNGSFDCDNEMLNRIWYTAAYVVRANLRKDYFAAILNDRGDRFSWTGDAYPAQAAALVAFANDDFVLKNLRYTASHPNGIESYELYWVFSLVDYYEYSGDQNGVEELLSQATKRLDHAYSIYGTNPNLTYFGWDERLGAGFENPNIPENQNAYKMLAIRAWNEFSAVLEDIGRNDLAEKYRKYAREKTDEILSDPDWYEEFGLHASADAINAGVAAGTVADELYGKYFTDRLNRLSYSPFNQYFILQAMANAGQYDDAVSAILDMYGGMIDYGATTFFEVYRPGWNDGIGVNGAVPNCQVGFTSLAHPWGAGVLTWMSEELLGIQAETAGFKTFSVIPHLGRQLTRVSGEMPTPYGTIEASFDTEKGSARVVVPDGTTGRIGIPKVEKTVVSVRMNGNPVTASGEDDEFIYIDGLGGGVYEFDIEYAGETPAYEESEYSYPATVVGIDRQTQGNWGGVYGSEGYLLCNAALDDISCLPDYVSSVSFRKAMSTLWASDTEDSRALASNPYNIGRRQIGAYYTNGVEQLAQSMVVDIRLKEKRPYTVALYFVDWDHQGRSLSVDLFDGDSLNLITPVQVIRDFSGGAYLIYQYDNSVRFRINLITGENATLSGIFFGTGQGGIPECTSEFWDGTNSEIRYSGNWTHMEYEGWGAYRNSLSFSNQRGNSATVTFEGTGVSYITSIESNRGIAEIFLDGVSKGTFDLYSPVILRQQTVFEAKGLPEGEHTLKIVVTGEKNPDATDCYVDVDAIAVWGRFKNTVTQRVDDQSDGLSYSQSGWQQVPFGGQNAYRDTISFSNRRNAYCEFTFNGNSISYIACTEPNRGIAEIFLDGVSQGTFDCYTPTMLRQQTIWKAEGLPSGEHTVRIVVTGEKNRSATDCYIDIDAFEYSYSIFTPESIAGIVVIESPKAGDARLTLPVLPEGFEISIQSCDRPELVALDGTLTYPDVDTVVQLTLLITGEEGTAEKTVEITVPRRAEQEPDDSEITSNPSDPVGDDKKENTHGNRGVWIAVASAVVLAVAAISVLFLTKKKKKNRSA